MQDELAISVDEFDKPVVLVRPQGAVNVPRFLRDAADAEARWNTDSIIGAIDRAVRIRRPEFVHRLT